MVRAIEFPSAFGVSILLHLAVLLFLAVSSHVKSPEKKFSLLEIRLGQKSAVDEIAISPEEVSMEEAVASDMAQAPQPLSRPEHLEKVVSLPKPLKKAASLSQARSFEETISQLPTPRIKKTQEASYQQAGTKIGNTQNDVVESPKSYIELLPLWINKHRHYPAAAKARGEKGAAIAQLHLKRDGSLVAAKIVESSGFSALDNEVLRAIKAANPLPAAHKGVQPGREIMAFQIQFDF